MRVKARVSFVGRVADSFVSVAVGQELDLPDGADWLTAGMVVEVAPAPVMDEQQAVLTPPNVEYAEARKRKRGG